jgi:branched-chain amino acid transport system substrate-binding protein
MTGWSTSALLLAAALSSAAAQPAPVLVGAVISQSGPHAEAGGEYRKGWLLWQDEVNAAGGLAGRRVELRIEDDGSEAARARRAYQQLLGMGAEVLIGPYGSAASLAATAEAERARRVMLNAAGPSSLVHRRSPHYVFQVVAPYTSYARGILAVAQAAGARSLFILARDDAVTREMAEAAQAGARDLGFARVELELYSGSVVDFLPQVYRAMTIEADAWIAFGEVRDAADMVKTLKRQGYVPRLFYARASTDPRFIRLVGQDAESILGSKPYDPRFATQGNAAFVHAFVARWSAPPGAPAAAAYAAGQVLAAAARRAGTLDAEKLRNALAALEVDTVLGPYRVDQQSGAQLGIAPAVTQIVGGRAEALWPAALAGDRALAPFVSWTERQVLK